jgi:hypothetical protein
MAIFCSKCNSRVHVTGPCRTCHNQEIAAKCDTANRWAKLPEPHRALINYAASVMREKFPTKTEDEYHRAESRLATSVRSKRRGSKRTWILVVPELGLNLERVETVQS